MQLHVSEVWSLNRAAIKLVLSDESASPLMVYASSWRPDTSASTLGMDLDMPVPRLTGEYLCSS